MIAAISNDGKLEHLHFHDKAIKIEHFMVFLKDLRKKLGPDRAYLFMDNLQVHKNADVRAKYA